MDKERILALADALETAHNFDMHNWAKFDPKDICETPSCMGGHAVYMYDRRAFNVSAPCSRDAEDWRDAAADLLGLDTAEAQKLFLPDRDSYPTLTYPQFISGGKKTDPYKIDGKQAAMVLRYFVETGEVDFWTAIYGPIESYVAKTEATELAD